MTSVIAVVIPISDGLVVDQSHRPPSLLGRLSWTTTTNIKLNSLVHVITHAKSHLVKVIEGIGDRVQEVRQSRIFGVISISHNRVVRVRLNKIRSRITTNSDWTIIVINVTIIGEEVVFRQDMVIRQVTRFVHGSGCFTYLLCHVAPTAKVSSTKSRCQVGQTRRPQDAMSMEMLSRRLSFNGVHPVLQDTVHPTREHRNPLLDIPTKNIFHNNGHVPPHVQGFTTGVVRQHPILKKRVIHNGPCPEGSTFISLPIWFHPHGHGKNERHESLLKSHGQPPRRVTKQISIPHTFHPFVRIIVPERFLTSSQ